MAYVGEYRERLRDGQGSYAFPGGSFRYEGHWKLGMMHGRGVLSLPDGGTYEGEFQFGEINGVGLRRWPNGSTYNGHFRGGERHGEGVMISTSGEVYEGHWENNQRQGLGQLRTADGDVYRGDFHHHKPHGNGRFAFAKDGCIYDGDWVDGKICGRGVLKDTKGKQLYDGEWFNGQRCGHGVGLLSVVNASPIVYDGIWADGNPLASTNKLALKLAVARPSTDDGTNNQAQSPSEMEFQDILGTITLDKKVGLRLPLLAGVSLHESSVNASPSIVIGETGRRVRLRVFEGPIPALSTRDGNEQSDDTAAPTPLYFTLAPELAPVDACSEEAQKSAEVPVDGEGAAQIPAPEEPRIDEVVESNKAGVSLFEKLAMPSTTVAGTFHLVCDCADDSGELPPVYMTLQIVE